MPGKKITKTQIEIYMKNRDNGNSQKLAAAKADISIRSGRNIEKGGRKVKERNWRTWPDPFEEIWDEEIIPLLKKGVFQATVVLRVLQEKYPGKYPDSLLRTLQRRMKKWRAISGPEKEVIFRQEHKPGMLSTSDFTHPKDITITINGKPFEHIYYQFWASFSGFSYVTVFAGSGESFEKFAQGLQEAVEALGGSTQIHQTDSLSALYKNLSNETKDDLTNSCKDLLEAYFKKVQRINPGKSHENGGVESGHRHFKVNLKQSLAIRGSSDSRLRHFLPI